MHVFNRRTALLLGTAALAHSAFPAFAAAAKIATDKSGIAIDGYDTTAYWHVGAANSGSSAHAVQWLGTPWHFADAETAAQFEAAPEKYAPQFGGFCTRAMSFGKVVNGDPEVWRIYQGKLYLFAQPVGGKKFDEGQDPMIEKAQANWDKLHA